MHTSQYSYITQNKNYFIYSISNVAHSTQIATGPYNHAIISIITNKVNFYPLEKELIPILNKNQIIKFKTTENNITIIGIIKISIIKQISS
jgi:hypothetical protein